MFKQTIQLFIKACIIGILINIGLEQVPTTTPGNANTNTTVDEAVLFRQPAPDPNLTPNSQ
jgi:hypothetical protein